MDIKCSDDPQPLQMVKTWGLHFCYTKKEKDRDGEHSKFGTWKQ